MALVDTLTVQLQSRLVGTQTEIDNAIRTHAFFLEKKNAEKDELLTALATLNRLTDEQKQSINTIFELSKKAGLL